MEEKENKKKSKQKDQWRPTSQRACGSWAGLAFIKLIEELKACEALNIKVK